MKVRVRSVANIKEWVYKCAKQTKPDRIHWCTGSDTEYSSLLDEAVRFGEMIPLNPTIWPNSFLYRSNPNDVARTEELTFVCTEKKDEAGPNNNWMNPLDAHRKIDALFDGCMKGRTMYVIPYIMGPNASRYSRCGIEITDSIYVVLNMRVMTRMGDIAMQTLAATNANRVVKGLHSIGELDPSRRFVMHFPDELTIKSYGSGYGGNALLGKKCHSLRIASWQGKSEGWLAEHMMVIGVECPSGRTHYIAAAFPSGCGKTNLSMLIPPKSLDGYKVWTVGDDICWIHPGQDGQLWAINPENGFFGVAPGTNEFTNPNALNMIKSDTIFTNVALTPDQQPWWEGLSEHIPAGLIDWQGRSFNPTLGSAAHPNSRFTVAKSNCPSLSVQANNPEGVPLSAIIFGGRRRNLVPLVAEAKTWKHGVFMGATMASETTAAASGETGVLRRDPMAMKPFCGYNMAAYWRHWLSFGSIPIAQNLPRIFQVNWFRRDANNRYLWPGFGDNLRVIKWIINRCEFAAAAVKTPIGLLPEIDGIDCSNLDISTETLNKLLEVDRDGWLLEMSDVRKHFAQFGSRVPMDLMDEVARIEQELVNH